MPRGDGTRETSRRTAWGVVALLAAAWEVLGVLGTLWGAVADGRWWSVPVAVPWLVACYWVSVGALRRALTA